MDWSMDSMDSMNSMDWSMDSMDSMNWSVDSVDRGVDSMDRSVDSMGNNRGMDSMGSMMGWGRSVMRNSLVGNISNIATVFISSVVVNHLDSAVRESNSVGSSGRVAISLLLLAELCSTVVISDTILESIMSRLFISGLRSVARGSRGAKG